MRVLPPTRGVAVIALWCLAACGGDDAPGANADLGPQTDLGPQPDMGTGAPQCGNGVQETGEDCDQSDLVGQSCASLNASAPVGILACSGCSFDTSDCRAPTTNDGDADDVVDDFDPEPANPRVCGDSDLDGCDDCSVRGRSRPMDDGYDSDGDGECELELDYDCMNGANAASDPYRLESCVMLTLINNDRAHFSAEAGGAGPVAWNEDIWEIAHAHSVDMCESHNFAHVNDAGQDPSARAAAAGLPYGVSENISANFDPGAAQYGFMEEPTCRGHRDNILDPRALEVGIGYHVCDEDTMVYDWGQHHHITQNFRRGGSNPSTSPYCQNAANSCEIPPNPPTTAICPQMLINWDFCPEPSADTIDGWGCPND